MNLVPMGDVAVEAQVGPLGCWALLEDGVVCGVFVCWGGVECERLGVLCSTELVGAGRCTDCCLVVELGLDKVEEPLSGTLWGVSRDPVAVTICNGYECFRARALGVCSTANSSSFWMSLAGIASVKTGSGGNSTAWGGDRDATENDWEKALDAMETHDPNKARLLRGDELLLPLLLPSAWRRMSARWVINSTSMGFLGI